MSENKISELKKILRDKSLDYLLVPMADEFGSEFLPASARRIEFLSNFTGSNAAIIIPAEESKKAAFFTDGRYSIQATKEVDQGLFNIYDMVEIPVEKWLLQNADRKIKVGFNENLYSTKYIKKLSDKFIDLIEFCRQKEDLVDMVWSDKPAQNFSKAFIYDEEYCGENFASKIDRICEKAKDDFIVITDSESVCWLLNIRGYDLPNTPVFFSHIILSTKDRHGYLFCNLDSISDEVRKYLAEKVEILDLKEFKNSLLNLANKKVLIDPTELSFGFYKKLHSVNAEINESKNPVILQKAIKNKTEIENMKKAHILDGIALSKFFYWLENEIEQKNNNELDEYEISERLLGFRTENENFVAASFDTIAGFGENGAVIHYRPEKGKSLKLTNNNMLLVDSGGQYFCGTSDVTRTIFFGEPKAEHKEYFTRVLKGHIAVASLKFPKDVTKGSQVDILARQDLWKVGADYKHGTGHGVGCFLNVHEGPQAISRLNNEKLREGMILSNEPGYYKEGEYGIRIENLIYIKQAEQDGFLCFEDLTMFPIEQKLIDKELLNRDEIEWLNNYHRKVFDQVSPNIEDEKIRDWLKKKTKEIE